MLNCVRPLNVKYVMISLQWVKLPKNQSEGVRFCKFGTQNAVPCVVPHTPKDCFFGNFATGLLF